MPEPRTLRCYGDGHLALVGDGQPRVDLDPHLPDDKKARDAALGALHTDFVVLTGAGRFPDALDVMQAGDAVLVASSEQCDRAARRLDLGDRLVDLESGDRVSLAGLGLQCLPAARGTLPGAEILPQADRLLGPAGEVLGQAGDTLGRALESLPLLGGLAGTGLAAGPSHRTRRPLALTLPSGRTVLLLGDSLIGRPRTDWLHELAEALPAEALPAEALPAEALPAEALPAEEQASDTVQVDVLVASVAGDRLDGLVQAVRELAPRRVVLYRDRDPYAGGSRNLPMASFVQALAEDAPQVAVHLLHAGQELVLDGAGPAT